MINKLNKSKKGKNQPIDFYDYYFKEISEKENIPIELFYYPLTKSCKKGHCLNSEYFIWIFSSQKFLEDFENFIENDLINFYKKEIKKKMINLAEKFEEWNCELGNNLHEQSYPEKLLEKIKDYAIKNSRCKIAWNVKEIKLAISRVK